MDSDNDDGSNSHSRESSVTDSSSSRAVGEDTNHSNNSSEESGASKSSSASSTKDSTMSDANGSTTATTPRSSLAKPARTPANGSSSNDSQHNGAHDATGTRPAISSVTSRASLYSRYSQEDVQRVRGALAQCGYPNPLPEDIARVLEQVQNNSSRNLSSSSNVNASASASAPGHGHGHHDPHESHADNDNSARKAAIPVRVVKQAGGRPAPPDTAAGSKGVAPFRRGRPEWNGDTHVVQPQYRGPHFAPQGGSGRRHHHHHHRSEDAEEVHYFQGEEDEETEETEYAGTDRGYGGGGGGHAGDGYSGDYHQDREDLHNYYYRRSTNPVSRGDTSHSIINTNSAAAYLDQPSRLQRHVKRYERLLGEYYQNHNSTSGVNDGDAKNNDGGFNDGCPGEVLLSPLRDGNSPAARRTANLIYNFTGDERYRYHDQGSEVNRSNTSRPATTATKGSTRDGRARYPHSAGRPQRISLETVLQPNGSTLKKKADTVRRGQQMRELWRRDQFLNKKN